MTTTRYAMTQEWITDRPPTEADGDKDGDVRMRLVPGSIACTLVHWSYVAAGAPWQHTAYWEPPAERQPGHAPESAREEHAPAVSVTPSMINCRIAALERKMAGHVGVNPDAITALERRIVELEKVVNQMIKGPNKRRSLGVL